MFKQWVIPGIVAATLLFPSAQAAEPQYKLEDIPTVSAESQQVTASRRIGAFFTRYHYGRVELNEAMGKQIFDRLFEQLDYNRMFMLQSDYDEHVEHRENFHKLLTGGELSVPFAIYQKQLQRRYERYAYALKILERDFDFDRDGERYYFDRSESPWATASDELDAIWEQRVRSDALNLAMAGRSDEEIRENLTRRYQTAIQRLTQTQSEDAFQAVMNAFARSVDAHTSYLSPRNAERFQQNMNLSLEGIGAVLQAEYDYTVIRSLVPGGPAERSGELNPNDRIIAVAQGDQEFVDVIGWRLDDVVELITGPKGSVVRLQVLRESQGSGGSPQTVEITREQVRLEDREAKLSVETMDDDRRVGVIAIPSFYNDLTGDVKTLLEELPSHDVEGLVIDLRGNGGGALNESIYLTGLFIPSGPIVQVRDSSGRIDVSRDPDPKTHYDGPLVVLVDRFSASASEIFAAALQDYGRALIVGEQTFGKGTVQQHRGLQRRFDFYPKPMGSVQYTIAKFYRIDGGSTQHRGVIPDIAYPTPVNPEDFGESRAENALPWDQIEAVDFTRLGNINGTLLESLSEQHQSRIAANPEFAYIFEDIERYREYQERDYVSLVRADREAESERDRMRRLQRANERLKRAGKETVESWDDVPSEFQESDPYLSETLLITLDFIDLLRRAS
ncbi:MAG: carboxy terminal-processing peptidase [Idiomarina sp.]|nr:carboxy terminal-processing peptidase [Idiomarina sp.]